MDGNRRWAQARGWAASRGHREGVETLRCIIDAAMEENIPWLTFYAFSRENWNRSAAEVEALMELALSFSRRHLDALHEGGVRLRVLGERAGLSEDLARRIEEAEARTQANEGMQVTLAFNYSGRCDIARAARVIAEEAAEGRLRPEDITDERFGAYLASRDMPPPDLLIRTGGERRLSNFLLWESAYAELLFLDALWPDFDGEGLHDAIEEFRRRRGRAGSYPNRAAGA